MIFFKVGANLPLIQYFQLKTKPVIIPIANSQCPIPITPDPTSILYPGPIPLFIRMYIPIRISIHVPIPIRIPNPILVLSILIQIHILIPQAFRANTKK